MNEIQQRKKLWRQIQTWRSTQIPDISISSTVLWSSMLRGSGRLAWPQGWEHLSSTKWHALMVLPNSDVCRYADTGQLAWVAVSVDGRCYNVHWHLTISGFTSASNLLSTSPPQPATSV